MLELAPRARLSWTYDISADGRTIGSLELARFASAGAIRLDERSYPLKRSGLFGPIRLLTNEREMARAERLLSLAPKYRVIAEDRQLTLAGTGFLGRAAVVRHGDLVVAKLRRKTFFSRNILIEPLDTAPVPLLAFCAAVMILYWRWMRRSSS